MSDPKELADDIEDGSEPSALLEAISGVDREQPKDEGDGLEDDFVDLNDPDDAPLPDDGDSQLTETEEEEETEEPEGKEEENIVLADSASPEAKQSFAALKESKESWKTKALEAEEKLKSFQTGLEKVPPEEEIEKLRGELAEYKEIVESEHFKEDPAFKSEYVKPMMSSREDLIKWARAGLISEGAINEASPFINQMAELLGDVSKEAEYLQAADEVANLFEKEAFKSRFITSAEKWFETGKEYNNAVSDKETTKKYLTTKRKERLAKESKTVSAILDSSISDWERGNAAVVKFYKDQGKSIGYDEIKEKSSEKAKKLFQDFYDTGTVTRELADYVAGGGIVGEVQHKAQGLMLELITANSNLIKEKNEKIKELEDQLNSVGGVRRGKKSSGNFYKDAALGKDDDDPQGSAMLGAIKSVMR